MREQTISTMGDAAVNRKGAREVRRRASPHQIHELSRHFNHESYTIADIYYPATVDDYQEPSGLCTRNLFYYTVIS